MTFIKVDLDKLKAFSRNLEDWRFKVDQDRIKGINQCSLEDPADIHSYFDINSAMTHRLGDLLDLKGSLDTRIVNVEAVNQTGVNPMDSSETGYYLPDGVADTTENVTAYNKHAIDMGRDLAEKLKESYDGKVVSSDSYLILQEIEKHQDIPAFGAAFVSSFGDPDDYLSAVGVLYHLHDTLDDHSKAEHALSVLSHTFAAATQHQNGQNGVALANLYADKLTETSGWGNTVDGTRILKFNALLQGSDATFGTEFLVTAANRLENLDPSRVSVAHPYVLKRYRWHDVAQDPLFGVVAAMGRNSEAALTYMTQDGHMDGENWVPGEKSEQRWLNLAKRTDSDFVDAFSGMLASASAYRNTPSDPTDPLYNPSGNGGYREFLQDGDARATWLTGKGLRHFSEDFTGDKFTEKMKANIGTMLMNSPEELDAATRTAQDGENNDDEGPSISNSVDDLMLSKLLYRVIDNESAATGINAALGAYHHNKIEQAKSADQINSHEDLAEMYRQASLSKAYLNTVADTKLKDNYREGTAEYEKQKSKADMANAVFSTVATAGVTAATVPIGGMTAVVAPAVTTAGLSIAGPFDAGFYEDQKSGLPGSKEGMATSEQLLRAEAYADAAEQGLLSTAHADAARQQGLIYDDSGQVVHPDPGSFSHEDWVRMNTWREAARANAYETGDDGKAIPGPDGKSVLKTGRDGTVVSLDTGITEGASEGERNARETFSINPSLRK